MPSSTGQNQSDKPAAPARLIVEDVGEHKWKWVKAAHKAGKPLAVWVVEVLDEAAKDSA